MTRVTLKDVAIHAGVSHQTVSNVLNNRPSMRPDTRERVLQAMEALDYHPNQAAKALREARITTLCCAFFDHDTEVMDDPYRNKIQAAIVSETNAHGYDMTTAFLHSHRPQTLDNLRRRYRQQLFGGVILVGTTPSAAHVQTLQGWGLPVVLFDHRVPDVPVASIDADYRQGITALIEHHVARGRRHLALILPLADQGSSTLARLEGFQAATERLGVTGRLINGDWTYESGEAAFHDLWQSEHRPDAVLASNDRMAAGALRAAHDLRLRIPEDVAISGFDDTEFARYTHPSLTTVHVPHGEMARTAVRHLLRLLEDHPAEAPLPAQVVFPVQLVVRESA